jgi:hypothetical protein
MDDFSWGNTRKLEKVPTKKMVNNTPELSQNGKQPLDEIQIDENIVVAEVN